MQIISIPAPASKSLSHRALMAAALAHGESSLSHILESDDTARTRDVLSGLGASFIRTGEGAYTVLGLGGVVDSRGETLSCFVGESGTTCRLITAILAAGKGSFRVHGAGRMHDRPIGELTDALRLLGVHTTFEGRPDCPPFVIETQGLRPNLTADGMIDMGADESSQYFSGLLLAAPLVHGGLTIRLAGSRVVSWPYVGLTLEVLEAFGITFTVEAINGAGLWELADWRALQAVEPKKIRFCVHEGAYRPAVYQVEGDWSGASYFLAAGAIGPRAVRVEGLNPESIQGDAALLGILESMGARVERGVDSVTVYPSQLCGIRVDMGHCPDLVPTVAALAAHAKGVTQIENVAHLKIKESDRLQAPAEELGRVGCRVDVLEDGLLIAPSEGGPKTPAPGTLFSAHNDHRIAMSASLLGLSGLSGGSGFAVPLDDPGTVAKSFPHFWSLWEKVRA